MKNFHILVYILCFSSSNVAAGRKVGEKAGTSTEHPHGELAVAQERGRRILGAAGLCPVGLQGRMRPFETYTPRGWRAEQAEQILVVVAFCGNPGKGS